MLCTKQMFFWKWVWSAWWGLVAGTRVADLIQKSVGVFIIQEFNVVYQMIIDIRSARLKTMVRWPQSTRLQLLQNKKDWGRSFLSFPQGISLILIRQHCFLLQSQIVGWQLFTSAERRLINFRLHCHFSAIQMDHRSFWSSTLEEPGTLWHSIDRTQTRQDSVTGITKECRWHPSYLMSEISPTWFNCMLIAPKHTSKN